MSQSKTLDLHGVRHADVSKEVDQFLGRHISNTYSLEIITGYSERMKELVRETLKDYNLTAEDDIINKGMLLVKL